MKDRVKERWAVGTPERAVPGHHLVEHDSQGPEIGAGIDVAAPNLLGRHVGRRPIVEPVNVD